MASKIGFFFALICLLQPHLNLSSDVDWEVLNFAISDPSQSNPEILKDAILNILGGFAGSIPLPSFPTAGPTTAAPATTATPTTTPKPCNGPVINWPTVQQQPAAQSPIFISPIYLQQLQQQLQQAAAQQSPAAPAQNPLSNILYHHRQQDPCGPNKLAEFVVNVPCPKPTQKPPREIVVKLPCPTTKKPEQNQCNCNCCPCNPCQKQKPSRTTTTPKPTTTKAPTSTTPDCLSESSEDSYEHYYPRGKFQRIYSED